MPIVFSMPNRNILLSDQKVAQVLNANNVQEATRINNIAEFVSGIIDWFRGGTQKKEIIALFHSLQESQHGATEMPEYRRLEKFIQLRRQALPEYQSQFQLQILAPTAQYDCGYTLKVNGKTLFQCDNVFAKSKEQRAKSKEQRRGRGSTAFISCGKPSHENIECGLSKVESSGRWRNILFTPL